MHIHHMSNTGPSSRTQQQTAATPTFSLSQPTGASGSSAGNAATPTSLTGSVDALTSPPSPAAAAPTNASSPFASMASDLQSILLGASQAAGSTTLPGQAAGAYGLAGSLLGA